MKKKDSMWGRVSGTEIFPELWTIVNELQGRKTQIDVEEKDSGLRMPY